MQRPSSSWALISVATLSLLLFSFLTCPAYSFVPTDNILLNCGATFDATDGDNRLWTKDSGSPYAPSNPDSSSAAQAAGANSDTNLPSQVPYGSARVMTSSASYSFNLSNGRHFIRLYFYPSSYISKDAKSGVFSVTSGPYTLLSNFSPSINALALNQTFIIREFFLTVSGGSLQLNFKPSSNTTNSYAFINGIEINSSPELFGSNPSNSSFVVGLSSAHFPVFPSFALQTVVRLNVGGNYMSPVADSNLSRIWYNDVAYIFGAAVGVSYSKDGNISIRYPPSVPDYLAPVGVYATARSMGSNPFVNLEYNLTWLIPVDNGFNYLIRLHFCEIQSEISKVNQRVFTVSINNQTAQPSMDVMVYASREVTSGSSLAGVPVYRDYAIFVPPGNGGRSDLWIALYPNMGSKPQYADAILNGLEVFKVNDSSGNLAGPNPDLLVIENNNTSINNQQGGDRRLMIVGALGGTVAVVVISACFYCLLCKCHQKEKGSNRGLSIIWMKLLSYVQEKNRKSSTPFAEKNKAVLNNYCRHFMLSEIIAATNNFDDALLIGIGGFGKVYMGEIDGGIKVAIKRGNQLSAQGVREFMNEIEMLSKLRHCHVMSLIGYCNDNSEMILVYNYMARGTLRQHLYGTNQPPLSWRRRLEICIGAAKGLHYLHTGAAYTLIHRDVKTTNILLDETWVAKVSDFGLSRMGASFDCSHVSTGVKGTFGYFDPEYFRLRRLTDKSDVYSFGVVMLELLCARPPVDESRPVEQISLSAWALHSMREGRTEQLIDPSLKGKITTECLYKFVEITEKCLAERSAERPSMANVLNSLEIALGLQISAEAGNKEEELAHSNFLDLYGNEYDFGSSMSSAPCQTDEDGSQSVADVVRGINIQSSSFS